MTFLNNLQSHKGGLIKLKTQLCWNDGRGWDNNPGRICLLLDAEADLDAARAAADAAGVRAAAGVGAAAVDALLLIEGQPQWIWVTEQDIDLLVNDPPTS
jgi:hypothetical protein